MIQKPLIWAFFDNRTGNRNQLYGILNELKLPYKKIEICYNKYSFLPNIFLQSFNNFLHVENSKILFEKSNPNILISCGRRTAPIALSIADKMKERPFSIQIMYPTLTLKKSSFDLIITPEHDNISRLNNNISTLGTPNQIKALIKKEKIKLNLKKTDRPVITLLVGGNHSFYKINSKMIRDIFNFINKKLKNKGSILVSTSRRTSQDVRLAINEIKKTYNNIKRIYHPILGDKKNPLISFLKASDEVVVTGDSMSMVSEVCEIKKPVRIYYNKSICSPKQINFCNNIISRGYAFPFETFGKKCDMIKTLNTSKVIVKEIKKRILLKYGKNKF